MEELLKLGKTIAKYAPELGAILPLPGATVIGNVIKNCFGEEDPNELVNKIENDPEAKIKLLGIQADMEKEIQELKSKNLLAILNDKQSARLMAVELAKLQKENPNSYDNTPKILALSITFSMIGFVGALFFIHNLDQSVKELLFLLLGAMMTKVSSVIDYYYGSSSEDGPENFINKFSNIGKSKD